MISRKFSGLARAIVFLVSLTVFAPAVFAQNAPQALRTENLVIRSGEKEHRFVAEIAETVRERSLGLMFREEMAADRGMLFIFDGEGERYFWMKNTPLPLDIIYIGSSGTIVSIAADTVPYSEKSIPSGAPAQFVLELNAGTAAKLGISVGDTVSSPSMTGG